MKKMFVFAVTMLLGASLSFAQTGTGSTGDAGKSDTSTKTKKHHHNKGGKKSKKSSSSSTTSTTPK